MKDLIYDFRTKALGNWRKWGPIVMIVEALDKRITDLRDVINENTHRTEKWAEETDKQITALEESRFEVHNHKPIFERLTKLEFGRDNLMKRMDAQEAPSPLLLDLVQRVCALDSGSDYEVHSVCEGCKSEDFCKRPEHMDFGEGQPFYYREKRTCGECAKPWHREGTFKIACMDCPTHDGRRRTSPGYLSPNANACPNFEAIK